MRTLRGWIARAVVGGRRWRNSFRVRLLVLGLIAITGTAITLTYTQSIQMREALLVELHARARTDGQLLNAMFAAPLIERDYASVVDSVSESVRAGSFEALLLCDSRGMLIAAAGPLSDCNGPSVPFKGLTLPQADGTVLQLFEVALSFGHQRLGLARFAFSLAAVDQIRRELMTRVIVISSLAIAAFMLAFAIAQSQVTRPLNQLVQAAEAIGKGDYSVRPRITSRTSELTILASAISRMATDIEERVTELALARDAATASDRAKSLFLANMSHEVRTPLAGVLGMLELAKPGTADPAVRKYLDTAEHAARHLLTIVNDILDFAQLEKGRLAVTSTPFSVRALVESTIPLVAAAAEERGNGMEVRIADDLPRQILGDEGRLRQVLLNLLSNAVKFTSQGTVSVEARTVDAGHRLLLTVGRYWHRHGARNAATHLRELRAGRRKYRPPVWGHGARPADLSPAARADGGQHLCRVESRPRVAVHGRPALPAGCRHGSRDRRPGHGPTAGRAADPGPPTMPRRCGFCSRRSPDA